MAAQEANILKILGNETVTPEKGNYNMYILLFSGKLITQLSEHVKWMLMACR